MRPEARAIADAVLAEVLEGKKYIIYGIKSEPPTLTVEDIDRFFRLMFDGEKAELSTPGAYLLVQLTQGRRSPFPFMSQTRSVQEAIIRVLMYNHEVKKVLLDMAFGGE
ncbi:MAG: hypothetical protein ACP5EK_06315 [Thermoplasmatota archaeon]